MAPSSYSNHFYRKYSTEPIGKQLRINLIKKEIKVESLDSNVLRKYIGGVGYRAKLLYDELSTNREFA